MSVPSELAAALGAGFTLLRELGGGGMSRVFLARDETLGRDVVVKLLSPDLAEGLSGERFAREIKLAAVLQEPHIVPVLSAGETAAGLPWYTMPFIAGESLRARLATGVLPLSEAVSLLRNVAQALSYAHAHGIVHRDIKPENILVSSGTAVVADFGIAKAVSAAKTQAPGGTLTQIGASLGTPAYMAPEQALGDASTDHRADLYAWGVVAYEALAGHHPFPGKVSAQQLIAAHLAESPRPLGAVAPSVPAPLAMIVMRCLEKDPDQRPQSASALVEALADPAMHASVPVLTSARAPLAPVATAHPRTKLVWVMGLAGVIVVVLVAMLLVQRSRGARKIAAAASASANATIATVAVLPFANIGGDPKDEYFSDGMTDELAHALAQLPSLRVAGRTSSYSFKGKNATAQDVGRALNVAGVIAGTVRRAGDRLRISAELTNAKDGLVLWSKTVEKRAADVFQVQDEVTKELVAAIAPALRGQTIETVVATNRGTSDPEAYDLYLRGRYFWAKRGVGNLERAIEYFKRAIAKDPRFARAHAGLAAAYAVIGNYVDVPPDSVSALAMESARRALAFDSTLSDARAALGYVLLSRVQLREAERSFQRAIARDPSNPNTRFWHAINLNGLGLVDSAYSESSRAEALDPMSAVFANIQGITLTNLGRLPESIAQFQNAIELDSTFSLAYVNLAIAHILTGAPDKALEVLERQRRASGPSPGSRSAYLRTYAALGRWSDVDRIAAEMAASSIPSAADELFLALVNGNRPAALSALEHGLTPEGGLLTVVVSPGCDAFLQPLHDEPRYQALMSRLGMHVCPVRTPWSYRVRPGGARR